MNRHFVILLFAATMIVPAAYAGETPAPQRERIEYPKTRRVDHIDTYFGVKVPDPYRWLEADVRHDKAVADWVTAENKVTARYLESIPERETIRRRLTELWNFPQYGGAFKAGGRYYLMKNDGLQNQPVLYVMDTLAAEPRPIIDPNTWSADGTIALGGLAFTKDGRYLAYSRAEAGSDWMIWYVMEIATGRILPDRLQWSKSGQASWTKDGKGFFYSRYDEPKKGAEFQSLNFNSKIFYHRLGDPQSKDVLTYYRPEHPEWEYEGIVTEDGHWLVIVTHLGTDERNRVTIIDLAQPVAKPIELIDDFEHEYTFVGNVGSEFYFKTDLDAPRRRLAAIDIAILEGPRNWTRNHSASRADADPRRLRRRSVHRFVSRKRQAEGPRVRAKRQTRARRAISGHRHGGRLRGRADRRRDVLHVLQLRHAAEHLSLRHGHGRKQPVPPAGVEVRPRRLRSEAGLLPQQGRHARADVHRL